ncbi:FAD-dependent oxidoreductase [Maricaulis sp.]|uniref:NAD(P)/FAD-dependent oxidoreductase n=1 Tax=Maricaulis sp. TaxID=1486257 RepID=UPI002625B983|nr:FAD-dependent oxidoreductase [Maricaulis sp.]
MSQVDTENGSETVMGEDQTVIIAGAGQAGGQCAASLRRNGWTGRILLAGAEPHPPYQRPPLSKAYLAGEIGEDRLWLQPRETWADQNVDLRLGVTATAIDRSAKTVAFDDGRTEHYDHLVLATGSRVRTLPVPGAGLEGVRYLRTIADVDQLRADVTPDKRIAIIGGGYIGLEAAAVAKKLGARPVVFEAMDRLLARVAVPELSQYYLDTHRAHGVTVELGAQVAEISGKGGGLFGGKKRVATVRLADGRSFECDSVLVGIGILPNQEIATGAGLATDNGIRIDAECRTADPAIYAIGDCAEQENWLTGTRVRLESVPNALEQAKHAAAAICGTPAPRPDVPWFWSDQFDLKLQTAGLVGQQDTTLRRRPADTEAGHFSLFHLKDGVLIAADCVNDAHGFMAAKAMIAARAKPDQADLVNPDVPMKDVMKAALGR